MSDPFGIHALAAPIEKGADFAHGMLTRICYPAADEVGLFLADKISGWRSPNTIELLKSTDKKLDGREGVKAHPRVVYEIIDKGSWVDDSLLREMWAGLLASSCTESGDDDEALLYIDLLRQFTRAQARLMHSVIQSARPPEGQRYFNTVEFSNGDLGRAMQLTSKERIALEIERLQGLGILVRKDEDERTLTDVMHKPYYISKLGVRLYVRAQGFVGETDDFFGFPVDLPSFFGSDVTKRQWY